MIRFLSDVLNISVLPHCWCKTPTTGIYVLLGLIVSFATYLILRNVSIIGTIKSIV